MLKNLHRHDIGRLLVTYVDTNMENTYFTCYYYIDNTCI